MGCNLTPEDSVLYLSVKNIIYFLNGGVLMETKHSSHKDTPISKPGRRIGAVEKVTQDIRDVNRVSEQRKVKKIVPAPLSEGANDDALRKIISDIRRSGIKHRAVSPRTITAIRVTNKGILTRKRALNVIQEGPVAPFREVSKKLAEESTPVFERYKHLVKRGD